MYTIVRYINILKLLSLLLLTNFIDGELSQDGRLSVGDDVMKQDDIWRVVQKLRLVAVVRSERCTLVGALQLARYISCLETNNESAKRSRVGKIDCVFYHNMKYELQNSVQF